MDIANSGKTKYNIYVNPELGKFKSYFPSVETLYDVPKAQKAMVKRKSRLQT